MSGQWILIIYVLILLALLYLLYKAVTQGSSLRWMCLFGGEIASLIFSLISAIYYNGRKGEGIIPGLTWIGESLFSIGAVAVFSILFIITIIVYIIFRKK